MKNNIPAIIKLFFLPNLLPISPPIEPPIMQPISALDTIKPVSLLDSNSERPLGLTKKLSSEPTVPEITHVS